MASAFMKRCRAERQLHEAIADYLAARGISEEASGFTALIATLGPPLPANSDVHWRKELARIRDELNKSDGPDYAFLLDHLIEVCTGMNVPSSLCRELFESKLFLHILVERLAIVFQGHDSELFKLESDVLCHGGGVYGICRLLLDRHFKGEEEATAISKFLRDFQMMFDDDDPKARWDEIFAIHQLEFVAFRRDLKRVLWGIDGHVLGTSKLVRMFEREDDASPAPPRKRVCRTQLEKQFHGSASEWRALSVVHSIRLAHDDDECVVIEDTADELETNQEPSMTQEMPSQETLTNQDAARVWSTRLPFTTSGSTTESFGLEEVVNDESENDNDELGGNANKSNESNDTNVADTSCSLQPAEQPETQLSASESVPEAREEAPPQRQTEQLEAPPSVPPSEVSDSTVDEQLVVRTKRKRWSQREVDALLRGYREFSALPNVWVMIKTKYADMLRQRSNIDIKDKYRNLLKYNRLTSSSGGGGD